MKPALALLFTLLCLVAPVNAAAQSQEPANEHLPEIPLLDVRIYPDTALNTATYVQAQLRMIIRLGGRYPYEALQVTLPDIEHAEIVGLARPRTRFLRSYAGAGHVYEASYAIFPQRSGTLVIPPVEIVGKVGKSANEDLAFSVASEAMQILVEPAVEGVESATWFTAEDIKVTDSWSIPMDEIRVGDVVRREVHIRAFGTSGDRMPDVAMPRSIGATVVDAGATRDTVVNVNGSTGHLWQAWDIRIDRHDYAEVAPVRYPYWSAEFHEERIAAVPVVRIEPLPADGKAIAAAVMADVRAEYARTNRAWSILLIVMALPFLSIAVALVWAILPAWRDLVLQRALSKADAARAYRLLQDWAERSGVATARTSGFEGGDQDFLTRMTDLKASVFSPAATSDCPRGLGRAAMRTARRERFGRVFRWIGVALSSILGRRVELAGTSQPRR